MSPTRCFFHAQNRKPQLLTKCKQLLFYLQKGWIPMSIDWKRKLTSRKFWVAVVAFITPLMLAFGVAEDSVTQIVAIVMAGADVLAYIVAEGMVDSTRT